MQEKALDEVGGGNGGFFFDVAVGAIAVAEGDGLVFDLSDAVVADGDFMGVASEVFEHLLWSCEGLFGIDDPLGLGESRANRRPVFGGFGQEELVLLQEAGDGAKITGAESFGQGGFPEEPVAFRRDPGVGVALPGAAGYGAVEVEVFAEFLGPGVQDGDEAELSFESPLRIEAKLLERGVALPEEEVDQLFAVMSDERVEVVREGEYDVKVRHGENFLHALGEPLFACGTLTGWAVAVAAGVVQYDLVSARGAMPKMPAQGRGAAEQEMSYGCLLKNGDGMVPQIIVPMNAKHIGHPQRRGVIHHL